MVSVIVEFNEKDDTIVSAIRHVYGLSSKNDVIKLALAFIAKEDENVRKAIELKQDDKRMVF